MNFSPARYISILGTEVHAAVANPAEGKTALREIRQKKAEYGLKRRALLYQQKKAKAAADKAGRTPAKKKTGVIAGLRRLFAKAKSAKPKRTLAEIENEIHAVDEILFNLDSCKVQIEGKLLSMG